MEDSQQKKVEFSGDEYIKIRNIAKSSIERGKCETLPELVVFTGGIGCGKTTTRKQEYAKNYVHFDYFEIIDEVKRVTGKDNGRLGEYVALATSMILRESIADKRNIVIEIIGDNYDSINPILDKMTGIGYKTLLKCIVCDPVEAYKRHLKAVKEDPNYISACYSQEATLSVFFSYFGLKMPPMKSETTN